MFDLVLGKVERPYRRGSAGATAASVIGHVVLVTVVLVVPLMWATDTLPETPDIMAFVAPPSAPPPPPPPPPPPAARAAAPQVAKTPASTNPNAAPIEAPDEITPEPAVEPTGPGVLGGVEGGIEGGVPGGVIGGLAGVGLPPPPPPPPLPPPALNQPVRIGGQVTAPALVHRVEPEYPAIAVAAHLEGMVILEATVDEDGRVTEVRILRSRGFLDKAAIEAVKQWRYQPLTLNGRPTPFVLTVTLTFALKRDKPLDVG